MNAALFTAVLQIVNQQKGKKVTFDECIVGIVHFKGNIERKKKLSKMPQRLLFGFNYCLMELHILEITLIPPMEVIQKYLVVTTVITYLRIDDS